MSPLARSAPLLLLAALAWPGPAQDPEQRADSLAAQLEVAATYKRALRGAQGRERIELRARAVDAYRAVRRRFPEARQAGAEAAFRAGELLRAAGAAAAARTEFEVARAQGEHTPFRARAGMELGHLDRRRGLHEEALATYQLVLLDPTSAAAQRDDAALWSGRSLVQLGRRGAALPLFERVATLAEDPVDRILGHDELALVHLANGDQVRAARELERCRRSLAPFTLEETPLGERVRKALERMRAIAELERARARSREGVVVER